MPIEIPPALADTQRAEGGAWVRARATGWTLARVLQNALWDIEDGKQALEPAQVAIAKALNTPRAHRR